MTRAAEKPHADSRRWLAAELVDDHNRSEVETSLQILATLRRRRGAPILVSVGAPAFRGVISINAVESDSGGRLHLTTTSVAVLYGPKLEALKARGYLRIERSESDAAGDEPEQEFWLFARECSPSPLAEPKAAPTPTPTPTRARFLSTSAVHVVKWIESDFGQRDAGYKVHADAEEAKSRAEADYLRGKGSGYYLGPKWPIRVLTVAFSELGPDVQARLQAGEVGEDGIFTSNHWEPRSLKGIR